MVRHGEASEKIFSHVLYQLSYLGFLLRQVTPAPEPGRYSEGATPCPGPHPPERRECLSLIFWASGAAVVVLFGVSSATRGRLVTIFIASLGTARNGVAAA